MNYNDCLFSFLDHQLTNFPKQDMFAARENGNWRLYSTQEVKDTVDKLSIGLMNLGIGEGNNKPVEQMDKIALISKNRPEWLMLDFACQQIGVCLCPIYPTTNVTELEFIFNDAQVKYCFVSGDEILAKVNSIKGRVESLEEVFSFDEMDGATYWKELLTENTAENLSNLESIRSGIVAKNCATIIYTSGTTGTPKGVMLSHSNIVSNVLNAVKSFPFEKNTNKKALSFLPLNHIFERMVSYIYISSGNGIYYAESLETIGDNLKEVKPNLFTTVPRLLEKVYEKIIAKGAELTGVKKKLFDWAVALGNEYDTRGKGLWYKIQLGIANKLIFSKWREGLGGNIELIITGGAACQVRLLRVFNSANIPIYEGYGPTENSPVITVNQKNNIRIGTVGPCIHGQQIKIEADGEICVKGPSVMLGYYKRPDLTAETIIDGWLHTGDIGIFEDDKYLKITDRKKELFKTSGGKYVAPAPIENKMKESPFVEQMMIVGAEQKYVGALIVPSLPSLQEWMRHKDIPFTTVEDAVNNPKVLALYRELIDSFNNFFNHVEQVKKFELLPNEWTVDTGELTPTLKLKRKVIMEKYKQAIERIYD
jgi:long-chain acyl-CoA synthetase